MKPLIILMLLLGFKPPVEVGTASQYSPNVMAQVVANRQVLQQLPEHLPKVDGHIAVLDCDCIGELWLVRPHNGVWELMLVADCAGPTLRSDGLTGGEWMTSNSVLMEVDYVTAERWNTVGYGIAVEAIPLWNITKGE